MANEQIAVLPVRSVNSYVTVVVPMKNCIPGPWDLVRVGANPELSIAVGSTQIAVVDVCPSGIVMVLSDGQSNILGGRVSSTLFPPFCKK